LPRAVSVRARLEDFQKQKDAPLRELEIERLMSLERRLDLIWEAEGIDATIKKQIVRLLVEEVIVQPSDLPRPLPTDPNQLKLF
jgi:hypothetical protein